MVNVHQAIPDKIQADQRIERKFFVLPRNIGFAYALLRQFCRLDEKYPAEQVNSLYFDTDDLEQYNRSASGEYHKDKVRIRWYHTLDAYRGEVPIFVELKSRDGFTSIKQRQELPAPVQHLETASLSDGIIPMTTLTNIISGFGYHPEMPLHPVIVISYWRYRFSEILTGMRVTLDSNIRSTIVKRTLGYGERDLKLEGGVIEVKGQKMELPLTLRRMKLLDLDWSRFSKYSSCLDSHLEEPGTMARLWPSGRTNEYS
jgi:hypothetical protein